jgi:hypothetical protein
MADDITCSLRFNIDGTGSGLNNLQIDVLKKILIPEDRPDVENFHSRQELHTHNQNIKNSKIAKYIHSELQLLN